jgi:hypothetical protein
MHSIQRRMLGELVNTEQERMRKAAAKFKILSRRLPVGTEENKKISVRNSHLQADI